MAGVNELVKVSFRPAPTAEDSYVVGFVDDPVLSETSDTVADELASAYISGAIVIDPLPALRIAQDGQSVTLAWPLSATNYVLQEADSAFAPADAWRDVSVTPNTTET